jgi:malonyl-CoA O-methyltransferase
MGERLLLIKRQPDRIVEWWGSPGCSDEVLREVYPQARRTVVEPDAAWMEYTGGQRRPSLLSVRRWTSGADAVVDADEPLEDASAELIWANMVVHAMADPPALFERWHRALQPEGFVMFSSLGPDTLRQLRRIHAAHGWGPAAVDFVDMHDYGDMLVHAGFADPVMDQEVLTLTFATPADLLAELRSLGGNVAPDRHAGLRTPRWRSRLEDALLDLRGPDGRLRIDFEVAYGHAFKAAPREPAADTSRVSLDDMRKLVREPRRRG